MLEQKVVETLAFSLFGFIFGIIFLIDSWTAPPLTIKKTRRSASSLGSAPRIRGLRYVLGGGIVPLVVDLFSFDSEQAEGYATSLYALSLAITIAISMLFLLLYSLMVTANRVHRVFPNKSCLSQLITSIEYVPLGIKKGATEFVEALDQQVNGFKLLSRQRLDAISFLNGIYSTMIDDNINHAEGVEHLKAFYELYLDYFIRTILSPDQHDAKYRASIYFL